MISNHDCKLCPWNILVTRMSITSVGAETEDIGSLCIRECQVTCSAPVLGPEQRHLHQHALNSEAILPHFLQACTTWCSLHFYGLPSLFPLNYPALAWASWALAWKELQLSPDRCPGGPHCPSLPPSSPSADGSLSGCCKHVCMVVPLGFQPFVGSHGCRMRHRLWLDIQGVSDLSSVYSFFSLPSLLAHLCSQSNLGS